jgi:hypothetical protein
LGKNYKKGKEKRRKLWKKGRKRKNEWERIKRHK